MKLKKKIYVKIINIFKCIVGFQTISFSQNLEDAVINSICDKNNGFYVDIGAHHPVRFSNTLILYLKGWTGINIDPLPGCKKIFDRYRPQDINLNIGISKNSGKLTYFNFSEPAFNTTNPDRARECIDNGYTKLISKTYIKVVRLESVFDKYLKGNKIDVMNIDVETMELDVLESNNWDKYRPVLIVMESLLSYDKNIDYVINDKAISFLLNREYFIIAKVGNAVFLKDSRVNE